MPEFGGKTCSNIVGVAEVVMKISSSPTDIWHHYGAVLSELRQLPESSHDSRGRFTRVCSAVYWRVRFFIRYSVICTRGVVSPVLVFCASAKPLQLRCK